MALYRLVSDSAVIRMHILVAGTASSQWATHQSIRAVCSNTGWSGLHTLVTSDQMGAFGGVAVNAYNTTLQVFAIGPSSGAPGWNYSYSGAWGLQNLQGSLLMV